MTRPDSPSAAPLLHATGLHVRFGPVLALNNVDFEVRPGEIQALMGENGAGKSTLIKCLTGVVAPTSGEIRREGRLVRPASPHEAEALGIATVYQEVGLIPHLSVAENICLGREPLRRFWPHPIHWGKVRDRARAVLQRLGLASINVDQPLAACSVAVQQMVAIGRALDIDARVLILDEPTSSLDKQECLRLLGVLRQLRDQGMGIVFISHFLDQVEAVADRVTILRDGQLIGTYDAPSLSRAKLISLMVGRDFEPAPAKHAAADTTDASASLLTAKGLGREGMLDHVDLDISAGEAVGLAGLLGSGRSETARLLFGADTPTRGAIRLRQRPVRFTSPRTAIAHGLALSPENRKAEGLFPSLSVHENIVITLLAKRGLFRRLPRAEQSALVEGFIASLGIKTASAHTPIARLSGGNQQKALLARWFATKPDLLILDEPTRGIDIAAKADVLRAVEQMRAAGMALLFISSELEEVVRTCTRVVVLRDRRSVAELQGEDLTENAVLSAVAEHHD